MSHADEVRAYVSSHYLEPARSRGQAEVDVLSGDVHRALRYANRYPLVCSALGTRVFEERYRVRRTAVDGPLNGANTLFHFHLLP